MASPEEEQEEEIHTPNDKQITTITLLLILAGVY
jgi:hypothetical protein